MDEFSLSGLSQEKEGYDSAYVRYRPEPWYPQSPMTGVMATSVMPTTTLAVASDHKTLAASNKNEPPA